MAVENVAFSLDDEKQFARGLVTRTLADWAEEARQDGESLKDAVARYEVDYAWHVLGCERTRDAVLSRLADELGSPVDEARQAWVCGMLAAAALAQPSDALMSFDNDVPEQLCHLWKAGLDKRTSSVAQTA
ncbi:hypothetical protein [Hydrogenophaga sp. BPS33]|uniref:hypothetical protein n=1 Tax=Hydrogenophaga sp. BPS33 TaxID=2651974 RepID=UPI00131FFD1F|nr:hypothetical protein [Hydrogenophaga sp. BPS33]QHE88235.1 hypothetical protein F9K07_26795 [Hydrogenophaga sp. BPS33]